MAFISSSPGVIASFPARAEPHSAEDNYLRYFLIDIGLISLYGRRLGNRAFCRPSPDRSNVEGAAFSIGAQSAASSFSSTPRKRAMHDDLAHGHYPSWRVGCATLACR